MYSYDKPRQYIKKQRHPYSQSYGFSSSLMWLWELDHKEDWALRNWCLWTVVLEKTLESPLDYKEIKPANLKGNQPWIFIGSSDVETPVLWPPDAKNQVIEKDPDAGKDWRREEKEMTEDEMVGWHHWLNGHEFEQSSGRWWGTGKPGVLQSMVLQRVGHNWLTEQQHKTSLTLKQELGEAKIHITKSIFSLAKAWNNACPTPHPILLKELP